MIKVSVLYPNGEGRVFDMAYYCEKHTPMVQQMAGPAMKGVAVEQGVGGATSGSPPTYLAMGHLLFESVESSQISLGPHAPAIFAGVSNYTNSQPVVQISEVKL